jgi:microcystin-dependent protein
MECFIGAIIPWAGNFEPRGWLYCDGRALTIAQWPALFNVIGLRYGGDGQTYFHLPNLKGRVAVGSTASPANTGGCETVTLTAAEIPAHGHNLQANTNLNVAGASLPDAGKVPGVWKSSMAPVQLYKQYTSPADLVSLKADTLGSVGTAGAHPNLQPYLAISYIICVWGEYPLRA